MKRNWKSLHTSKSQSGWLTSFIEVGSTDLKQFGSASTSLRGLKDLLLKQTPTCPQPTLPTGVEFTVRSPAALSAPPESGG